MALNPLAVRQVCEPGEQAAAVAVDLQALVDLIHRQRAGHHHDVIGTVDRPSSAQSSARRGGPGVDAQGAAVLMQLTGAPVKGNRHMGGFKAQAALPGDGAGGGAQKSVGEPDFFPALAPRAALLRRRSMPY